MLLKALFLTVCLNICLSNAALLFWSNQKLEITPLAPFDDGDLESLVQKLGNPKLYKFKVQLRDGNQIGKLENVKEILKGYHSAYNPSGNIGTADAVELEVSEECHGIDTAKISKVLSRVDKKSNFLAVIDISSNRQKRDVSPKEESVSLKADNTNTSVFYSANNTLIGKMALLYSPKSLVLNLLKEGSNETILLSNTENVQYADTRLIVIIANSTSKVILRFNFEKSAGYWYLPRVSMDFVPTDTTKGFNDTFNSTTKIFARSGFSYHCGTNPTVFRSSVTNSTLKIYGMQVQVNTTKAKFSDAYDCVGFTTIPIWSGLFITAIMGIMMAVAITAMLDIKTMDRFDNYKTKNLAINVLD